MKILVYSISSPPEKTGIGKYNAEMIEYFNERQHDTTLLTTLPYYPEWKLLDGYQNKIYTEEYFGKCNIIRVWSYLSSNLTTSTRILKELTFYLLSLSVLIRKKLNGYQPDIVIYIAPPFFLPFITRSLFSTSKHVYHIQDLEIDAAIELGLLPRLLQKALIKFERKILDKMDIITTISHAMIGAIKKKGNYNNVYLFPNWADSLNVFPKPSTWLHEDLGLDTNKKLIVYSGNIGEKQGLERILFVAKGLEKINELHFVIIGEGSFKDKLLSINNNLDLSNVSFRGLVEKSQLNQMLNSSFIQLVLQKKGKSNSFFPSKLSNILAAGIPSVVTAEEGSGLHSIININKCGITAGETEENITDSILLLYKNTTIYNEIKSNSIKYANKFMDNIKILNSFEKLIT